MEPLITEKKGFSPSIKQNISLKEAHYPGKPDAKWYFSGYPVRIVDASDVQTVQQVVCSNCLSVASHSYQLSDRTVCHDCLISHEEKEISNASLQWTLQNRLHAVKIYCPYHEKCTVVLSFSSLRNYVESKDDLTITEQRKREHMIRAVHGIDFTREKGANLRKIVVDSLKDMVDEGVKHLYNCRWRPIQCIECKTLVSRAFLFKQHKKDCLVGLYSKIPAQGIIQVTQCAWCADHVRTYEITRHQMVCIPFHLKNARDKDHHRVDLSKSMPNVPEQEKLFFMFKDTANCIQRTQKVVDGLVDELVQEKLKAESQEIFKRDLEHKKQECVQWKEKYQDLARQTEQKHAVFVLEIRFILFLLCVALAYILSYL